jgi:hypothetical protein
VYPGTASGWNAYAGVQGGTLYLQNATPIPITQLTYTFAGAPVSSGYMADSGQFADAKMSMQLMIMRG